MRGRMSKPLRQIRTTRGETQRHSGVRTGTLPRAQRLMQQVKSSGSAQQTPPPPLTDPRKYAKPHANEVTTHNKLDVVFLPCIINVFGRALPALFVHNARKVCAGRRPRGSCEASPSKKPGPHDTYTLQRAPCQPTPINAAPHKSASSKPTPHKSASSKPITPQDSTSQPRNRCNSRSVDVLVVWLSARPNEAGRAKETSLHIKT